MDLMTIILLIMLAAQLVFTGIVVFNFLYAGRLENISGETNDSGKISILVPARNEEKNIGRIINSIENQDYKNYELIIVDDNSDDATFEIADSYASRNEKIKIYKGEELPEGWLGKNWACFQLSKYASGNPLLFIDADVHLENATVGYSLRLMQKNNLSLFSVFPSQIIRSFGEMLIVPLMNWFLLTFLPLSLIFDSRSKSFVAANGQFLMITREAYNEIGKHEAIRDKVVEDMEIARAVKSNKRKAMTYLGGNKIKAEMYKSFSEAFDGFSKNFFPGFNTNRTFFISLIIILFLFYTLPFILVFIEPLFLIMIFIILAQRVLLSILNKESVLMNSFLHIVQMLMMLLIGFNSTFNSKKVWKGRTI
jgi:chlorobactene glucosyltransferase